MIIKKDIYMNEEGMCMESSDGMPKGWAKGKLIEKKGQEMSDAEYKALKFVRKKQNNQKKIKQSKTKWHILSMLIKQHLRLTLVYGTGQDDNIDKAINASRLIDAICGRRFF